jgi:hypothetical protein
MISIHDSIINSNTYLRLDEFTRVISQLEKMLPNDFYLTKKSIREFTELFPRYADGQDPSFTEFSKWWGRGQQYISLVKKTESPQVW